MAKTKIYDGRAVVDTVYDKVFNLSITDFVGRLGENPVSTVSELGRKAPLHVGRGAIEATLFGARIGNMLANRALRASGLKVDILNPDDPVDRKELRERAITVNRRPILELPIGIKLGTGLFVPWASASQAVDLYYGNTPKHTQYLAEDYEAKMEERGIDDSLVRHNIMDRIFQTVPLDDFDDFNREMASFTFNSLHTPLDAQ